MVDEKRKDLFQLHISPKNTKEYISLPFAITRQKIDSKYIIDIYEVFSNQNMINERIEKEICCDILRELSDDELICDYMNSPSVQRAIKNLEEILRKYMILFQIIRLILSLLELKV